MFELKVKKDLKTSLLSKSLNLPTSPITSLIEIFLSLINRISLSIDLMSSFTLSVASSP